MRGDVEVLVDAGPEPLEDPIPEPIVKGAISIELEAVASDLASPVDLKPAADGTGRLFVVDQAGKV